MYVHNAYNYIHRGSGRTILKHDNLQRGTYNCEYPSCFVFIIFDALIPHYLHSSYVNYCALYVSLSLGVRVRLFNSLIKLLVCANAFLFYFLWF